MTKRRLPLKGPSEGLRGWWQLAIESLVCIVLIGGVVLVWIRNPVGLLNGTTTAVLVGVVLRVAWH